MNKRNVLYAQSGGVTSVINATATGVIQAVSKSKKINRIFAAKNGILGVLREEIYDVSKENVKEIEKLLFTPGGAFGSCRYKLKNFKEQKKEYLRKQHPDNIPLMQSIKKTMDPNNIMNPGKVFDLNKE